MQVFVLVTHLLLVALSQLNESMAVQIATAFCCVAVDKIYKSLSLIHSMTTEEGESRDELECRKVHVSC